MARKTALGAALFQTKLSLYTSYVLAADIDARPEALFWDTGDPYEYLRIDVKDARCRAIFGGEDVKTGQESDTSEVFARLEQRLRLRVPSASVTHRWMGQVIETDDGLPFIGEQAHREFIATGFCGNGMTLGTLSAMLARDAYFGRRNPWADLLRPDRKPFHGGLWRYLSENLDYPYYLLRDRLASTDESDVEAVAPGEGRIVRFEGKKVAAFRDEHGTLTLCSPVCTHLKCLVRWNGSDKTWDCPCHGSRFRTDGRVVSGPAQAPLERLR
jgi:nitrite reductase/ring-hydroxylating ferredoxin subunit